MAVLCADPPDTRPLGEGGSPSSAEEEEAPVRQPAASTDPRAAGGDEGQIGDVGGADAEPFSLGTARETSETDEAIFPVPAPAQEDQAEWYMGDGYGGPYWGAASQVRTTTLEQQLWLAKAAFWAEMARRTRGVARRRPPGAPLAEWGGGDGRMHLYGKALDAFREALSRDGGAQAPFEFDLSDRAWPAHGPSGMTSSTVVQDVGRTAVMLRNLPNNYTRRAVLDTLDMNGFYGKYIFFYKPVHFSRCAGKGYCFVDFVDHASATEAIEKLMGFNSSTCRSGKTLEPVWSEQEQGYSALVDRFQNSPLNHPDMPDEYKPKIYVDGQERSLPPPAAFVRMPSVLAPFARRT